MVELRTRLVGVAMPESLADALVVGWLFEWGGGLLPMGLFTAFFISGTYLCYRGFAEYRRGARIRNTATERVQSIALGRTALSGVSVVAAERLSAPFDADDCLFAYWQVLERPPDDDSLSVVDSGVEHTRFRLRDGTGTVLLEDPVTAFLAGTSDESIERYVPRSTFLGRNHLPELHRIQFTSNPEVGVVVPDERKSTVDVGPDEAPPAAIAGWCVDNGFEPVSDRERRYVQYVLREGADIYVQGGARTGEQVQPDEGVATDEQGPIVIGRDGADGRYTVAEADEDTLSRSHFRGSVTEIAFGLTSAALGLWLGLDFLFTTGVL